MYPRDDLRSCARHIAAQCREAVLASRLARVDDARERPRRSFRKTGRSTSLVNRESDQFVPPDTMVVARVTDLPDTRRRAVHHSASQREDDRSGRRWTPRIHNGVQRCALAPLPIGFVRSDCFRSRSIPFGITRGAQVKNINVTSVVRKKEASRESAARQRASGQGGA